MTTLTTACQLSQHRAYKSVHTFTVYLLKYIFSIILPSMIRFTKKSLPSGFMIFQEIFCVCNVCYMTHPFHQPLFIFLIIFGKKKKGGGKAVPLQAWSGPEGSRKLRFPDYMTTAQDGGKVVSLMQRPPLPSGNAPGTHSC